MNTDSDLRKRAEKAAAKKTDALSKSIKGLSENKIQQILHELQVHQIELEMQNDELRRTHEALDASRERYFDLYDMAPVGYCTLSKQGLIIEANLKAATLLGISRNALVKKPLSRFIAKEDQDLYYLRYKQLFDTDNPQEFDLRLHSDGNTANWVHIVATVVREPSAEPACRLVISDITAQKYIDDEHELAARLVLLVNTPKDLKTCMSELTLALQHWSGCEAVGIRLQQEDDYPYYETRGFPPEFIEAEKYLCVHDATGHVQKDQTGDPILECMCGNVLRGRTDPSKPFFTEFGSFWTNSTSVLLSNTTEKDRQSRTRNRCNKQGYESVALIPLRVDRQVFGLLQFNDHRPCCFTVDMITHFERMADSLAIALSRRQAEESLVRAKDEAEAASRAKSTFLANMSHELRTPLNPILGFTELLLEDDNLTDDQRDTLAIVIRRSRDLLQLLSDILDIARIEANRIVVHPQPCCVHDLVTDIVDMFCLQAQKKTISIVTHIAPELQNPIIVDAARLRQILLNLLGNALKFTETGSIEILADLTSTPKGLPVLHFAVRDTGCGIAPQHLESIFEQFAQIDDSSTRACGGAGLGLAICKRLTKLLGGEIRVESTLGEGSCFDVTLRIDQPHTHDKSAASTDTINKHSDPQKQLSILLIEDDESSALLTRHILDRNGHHVTCVTNGLAAIDLCNRQSFDLILMDIKMPNMDGYQATRIIRKTPYGKQTPIVAITACAFDSDRKECIAAGMNDWIPKPVSADDIKHVLQCVI